MMRMSDLMACEVYDAGGTSLGKVRDVRLVMDGPLRGGLAALRVDAIVIGGDAIGGRLGYLRGGVRGPALIAAVMRRLEDRATVVPASDVEDWDLANRRIVVAADSADPAFAPTRPRR